MTPTEIELTNEIMRERLQIGLTQFPRAFYGDLPEIKTLRGALIMIAMSESDDPEDAPIIAKLALQAAFGD